MSIYWPKTRADFLPFSLFINRRQAQSPAGQFFVDQIYPIGGTGIEQVIPFAAAELKQIEVGLGPVKPVAAFCIAISSAVKLVPASLGVERKVPHPEKSVGLLNDTTPGLCPLSLPGAIGDQYRPGVFVHSVEHT